MKFLTIINFVLTTHKCHCLLYKIIQDYFIMIFHVENQQFNCKIQKMKNRIVLINEFSTVLTPLFTISNRVMYVD